MANVFDVDGEVLIRKAAAKLKGEGIEKPEYISFVKSSPSNERVPQSDDFWYERCASILRQVYLNNGIGVSKLRTRYGGRKRHGVHKHHHMQAGGSIIRDAFRALEKKGYIKKAKVGREITPQGQAFLDGISNEILKGA